MVSTSDSGGAGLSKLSLRILSFGAIFLALGLTFETHSLTFAGSVLLATAAIGRLAFLRTP